MMPLNIEHIANSLGKAKKTGNNWLCCCPVHDDVNPSLSLSINNETLLAKCFAGCSFLEIISALRYKGLLSSESSIPSYNAPKIPKAPKVNKNKEYALEIWNACEIADNSLVEVYLKSRGYDGKIPDSLRYHPNLKHSSGNYYPAMVGAITDQSNNDFIGIHRTFLEPDGKSKVYIYNNKMMLGSSSGGGVMLGNAKDKTIVVAEGIETGLSVYLKRGLPVLACLSSSGMANIKLPPVNIMRCLIIALDNDKAGIKASEILAMKEGVKGRIVKTIKPPKGKDFNDLLMEGGMI